MNNRNLSLETFDNRLMDGLLFCKRVYDLFEQIRKTPDGKRALRLRSNRREKKLEEELVPIARYIQARYGAGRRIRVRWMLGSQRYDARLLSSGGMVDRGMVPKSQYIEVTTAVHKNDYLYRILLDEKGGAFGVKGITVDPKTRAVDSQPHPYTNSEAEDDLTRKILEVITAKNSKAYPADTVLVIQCFLDHQPFLLDEWRRCIDRVRQEHVKHKFLEIFVCDAGYHYSDRI